MKDQFAGKTAIVTGAASGIGRETARQLAASGTIVLVTDLPGSPIDAVVAEISAAGGVATGMAVDVSSREQLQAAVDFIVDRHGRLDYMVNNAGVAIFGEVEVVSLEEWDKIIDVNLRGVAYGATIAYRQMVVQGHGHIICTASVAGLVPVALQTHYCTTKHAIVGLCRTLDIEAEEHGIQVTVFCPAWVESGMFEHHTFRGSLAGADARSLVPIRPIPTERAVARLLRGVAKGRSIVITPFYGRVSWRLERLSPTLSHRLHRATLKLLRRRAKAGL